MSTPAKVNLDRARNDHLLGLDLLRFLSASVVVFNHFGIFSAARPDVGKPFAFQVLTFASNFGWVGVEVFFVISGFVIALSARGMSPSGFVKRRAVRVFPALWICSCIGLLALATTKQPILELANEFVRSITLFPQGPYIDGAIWTLVVEAVFYMLIWAVLWTGRFEQLSVVAIVLGIVSALYLTVYGVAEFAKDIPMAGSAASILGRFAFKVFLLRHGVFFALGIFLWLGYEYGFSRRSRILMGVMALFGALEIAILAHSSTEQPTAFLTLLPVFVWSIGILILIASIHLRKEISKKLERHTELIQNFGLVTFPLYLNHYTLGRVMVYSLISSGLGRPISFAIAFTVIVGSSWLIMLGPERALQSRLRQFLGLKSSRVPGVDGKPSGAAVFHTEFKQDAEKISIP